MTLADIIKREADSCDSYEYRLMYLEWSELVAQLESDKRRLDWLENNCSSQTDDYGDFFVALPLPMSATHQGNFRLAIDAAMKGDSSK